MGTAVTLAFAVVLLGLRIDPTQVDWPLLAVTMLLGLPPVLALGIVLAAVCLQTRQESWSYPEAFAGALFLVSGAVFPLAVLPDALQVVGLLNPLTWWVAGVRLALLPDRPVVDRRRGVAVDVAHRDRRPGRGHDRDRLVPDRDAHVTLVATVLFRVSERRARDRGLLDRTTGS